MKRNRELIDLKAIYATAHSRIYELCRWLLPGGCRTSDYEYFVDNPKRNAHDFASLSIDLDTGCWYALSCDASGEDVVSLVAYIWDVDESEAARRLAKIEEARHD